MTVRTAPVVALVVAALIAVPGSAAAATRSLPVGPDSAKPYFDSRAGDRSQAARAGTTVAAARPTEQTRQARAGLRRDLGRAGVFSVDPLTGTARQLLRTDGALSRPRGGARSDIAMDFVRANRAALGLDAGDLDGLDLAHRATTPRGLTVLRYRQLYRGIPAFDNDLRVAIDRAGRVLSAAGAPRHDLAVASITPSISGAEALERLQRDVGAVRSLPVSSGPTGAQQTTKFEGGDFARLVLFGAAGGAKLAWHVTYRATSTALYDAVVDASSGAILYRQNLTKATANANVYPNHPGASPTVPVDLEDFGLPAGATVLDGEFSRQWADLDDDNVIDPAEETPPSSGFDFAYPFAPAPTTSTCTATKPCAWDTSTTATRIATRTTNQRQNGVQAFYLVSRFHDHLENPAIGFDAASGNFEQADGDAVLTQTDDGAEFVAPGSTVIPPDAAHRNNANMTVPPDGASPTMQMYLFRDTAAASPAAFRSINGGDDSGVVWHEYTHGLSGRLVTNADGSSALSTPHAGAMGEGWSDWFASDLQVRDNLKTDTLGTPGEIDIGDYTDRDPHKLRSQAADCPVGAVDAACPGGDQTSVGGYTLGDFGKIAGAPEVHADGEIWFETLWDLRQALQVKTGDPDEASDVAESLIADGMRLSPPEPSMLDMRNAILAADQAAPSGGAFHDLVWDVFRKRGMGYFASATDGADMRPVEDFTPPPDPEGPKGTATGIVTDSDSGLPIAGVRVGFGGHASQPTFADYLADQTDASGRYTIEDVPAGSYPKLFFFPTAGYDPELVRNVAITPDAATTHDIRMTRDWASLGGGALLSPASDETGNEIACGPDKAFDQSQGTAWSSFNPTSADPENPNAGPPTVVVQLPQTLDVTAFLIDPSAGAGCGNDASASTREFTLETSTNGTTFRSAVDGTGVNGFTDASTGLLNRREPAGTSGQDVRFVRVRLISPLHVNPECAPQGCAGTDFIDITELKVLGGNPNQLPTGSLAVSNAGPRIGQAVTFDAGSFTDADSAISGYDWDFDGNGTVDRSTSTPTTAFAYGDPGAFNAKVAVKDFRGGAGNGSASVTVAPPAPGPAGTPGLPGTPGAPGFPPALGPLPSVRVPTRGTAGAIRPSVRCSLRCTVRAKLAVSRATARRLGLKHRTIARLKRTLTTTARRRLRLRVPAKVRAAAKRAGFKRLRATLTVSAKHAGGRTRTVRKAVRIKL